MLYFAKSGNYVKIGNSIDPKSRIRQIQTCCPQHVELAGIMPGNQTTERSLHQLFKPHHVHGEWFKFDKPIQDYIEKYTILAL